MPAAYPATQDNFTYNASLASPGYVYYQFRSELSCEGIVTSMVGVSTDVCFFDTNQNMYYLFTFTAGKTSPRYSVYLFNNMCVCRTDDCSTLHIVYFEDASCTTVYYSGVVDNIFTCQDDEARAGTYLSSREFICVPGDNVPIPMSSVVYT